jgi:hypothetical protein
MFGFVINMLAVMVNVFAMFVNGGSNPVFMWINGACAVFSFGVGMLCLRDA